MGHLVLVLILAILIPFPLCLFRYKKFEISLMQMLIIYVSFSVVGAIGAFVGSLITTGSMGIRLYGLILLDTVALFVLSRILKIKVDSLGDFVAVPIMAVCFSAKIACVISGCCYGVELSLCDFGKTVRFPSQWVEMILWFIIVVLLLVLEKNGRANGIKWHVSVIYFGFFRFLTDFMRGAAVEREILVLGMTGAQFWSLCVVLVGIVLLIVRNVARARKKF